MFRLLILFAAVSFGTTGTAQALAPAGSPVAVGAARIAVGALILAAVAWWTTRRKGISRSEARGQSPSGGAARWRVLPLVAGAVGVAAYQLGFFAAVADTGVAVGTVVALGSGPAFAGAFARVAHGTPLSGRWAASTALATAGVVLLVLGGAQATVSAPGVALALVAGASYAAYTVAAKGMLDQGHAPEAVMARTFGLGALLLAPALPVAGVGWLGAPGGLALALYLGAVPTALAYVLFARGLREVGAGEAATLTLAEPLTAALLGAAVLGEQPGVLAVAGAGVVLAGLAVLAMPARTAARDRPGAARPRALSPTA